MTKSELDQIKGIGTKTKEILVKKIGSIEKIKNSSLDDLKNLIGMKKASLLIGYFKK
jgi:excinuclease ABC subunit C